MGETTTDPRIDWIHDVDLEALLRHQVTIAVVGEQR